MFNLAALGRCPIAGNAKAVSINVTAIPADKLGFLTLWASGSQPFISTLNATNGGVVSNAAIVPTDGGSSISAFVTDAAHLVIDVNGYFIDGSDPQALSFYTLAPCRAVDTRDSQGKTGLFGPPSLTAATGSRRIPMLSSSCGIPSSAKAYSLNVTVVPKSALGYLTLWPSDQPQPFVSTLNAPDGRLLANAAIVPAAADGSVSVYAFLPPQGSTDVIVDINGYFAPPGDVGALSLYLVAPYRLSDSRRYSPVFFFPGFNNRLLLADANDGTAAMVANVTIVPTGPVGYLSIWAANQAPPTVSTLNSPDGRIVANAAIIPLAFGYGGLYYFNASALLGASATADLVIDVVGFFQP